jgi:plastocyanin
MLLLAGCVAAGPSGTATPSAAIEVTIRTGTGETLAFEPAEIIVRAAGPVTVTFQNGSSVPHNLVFTGRLTAASRTIVEPGSSERLLLVPPSPGTYPFVCTIHAGMAGNLIVRPASTGGGPGVT